MTAYGNNPAVHRITDGMFVCSASADAECRTLPTCECDEWCCCDGSPEDAADNHDLADGEHCCMVGMQPGRSCWIEPWIDATGLGESYAPQDGWGLDFPDGPVTVEWEGDGCEWSYADDTLPRDPDDVEVSR